MVRSRYGRGAGGAVEVHACGRGTLGRGTLMVRSRYAHGAVEVHVHARGTRGTVEVRFQCASGSVWFVNFSTGDTVCVNLLTS